MLCGLHGRCLYFLWTKRVVAALFESAGAKGGARGVRAIGDQPGEAGRMGMASNLLLLVLCEGW
ncbi:hypothetical protein CD58_07145 [Pseudomonas brassicacearum]|nr:hypothetical protein CD58_07145 [Pseudomonas brassicacearum]